MNLLARLRSGQTPAERLSWNDLVNAVTYTAGGNTYALYPTTTYQGDRLEVGDEFSQWVHSLLHGSTVVSTVISRREMVLSSLRFLWRSEIEDDQGKTFTSRSLAPLQRPGQMTRPVLLKTIERHACLAGNAFVYRRGDELKLLRPDLVDVMLGSRTNPGEPFNQLDVVKLGYLYYENGRQSEPTMIPVAGPGVRQTVAHFYPEPDPFAPWKGESWVMSCLREALTDQHALQHGIRYFENSATPNMIVTAPPNAVTPEQFEQWVDAFDREYAGWWNAFKTIYLSAGADAKVVGANLADLDLSALQGGFETRVAARGGVPVTIAGFREGNQGSALNASTYGMTRRQWADGWFDPYALDLCAALEPILDAPGNGPAELTYDRRRVMLLQEDEKDAADIATARAAAARQLVDGGFDPDSVIEYMATDDVRALMHTGIPSVQLQEGAPVPANPSTEATPDE